jgi:TetR/AcrR family transcriptional regulator
MAKDTFEKIAPEKRERVLTEAAVLFAERGFTGTDVGELATRAGIAKGSIYNYFTNKDDLYLTVCHSALEASRRAVWGSVDEASLVIEQIETLFRRGVDLARQRPHYVALYLNITSAGMERFAEVLSSEVERATAQRLRHMLRAGIERGEVRSDLDVDAAAFTINSLYIMVLASLVSLHYELRFREYFSEETEDGASSFEAKVEKVLKVIRQMVGPRGPQ